MTCPISSLKGAKYKEKGEQKYSVYLCLVRGDIDDLSVTRFIAVFERYGGYRGEGQSRGSEICMILGKCEN